ncbi:hypothetical protein Slin15195_G067170 [Septoria linicola]|uniref:Uncharacterized protein n=1 Tax=Septoria linicola TaxID=215465 RepID=A0A9Q9AWJ1_9PEZI|nr:hypothetical protein Slin15195_G067170 [Septoria linicola]
MVFTKRICPPERQKAVLGISIAPSFRTLSISNNDSPLEDFHILITLRIIYSKQPSKAITIRTNNSVFAPSGPADEYDTLSKGTVALSSSPDRHINLGRFISHTARPSSPPSRDLKERPGTHLLTIPAQGEFVVKHAVPLARIFKFEERLKPEDLVDEVWKFQLRDGFVGTSWWCWGDLEGELKEKRLSAWHEGLRAEIMPKPDVDNEAWVFGCNPIELIFEDRTEDSSFRFVA